MPMTFGVEKSTTRPFTFHVLFVENPLFCIALMNQKTAVEYKEVLATCKSLFEKKTRDYGTAWRILRLSSITDQIYIKAQRIRSIQEKGVQKVDDPIKDEFTGIINYCIIALIQIRLAESQEMELPFETLQPYYDEAVNETFELLQNKNHDY